MKVVNYQKYRKSIRQRLIDVEIKNSDKPRTIISPSGEKVVLGSIGHSHDGNGRYFLVEPKYEKFYIKEIQRDKNLWKFYNKWICIRIYDEIDQTALLNLVICCHGIIKKGIANVNQAVLFFLLDVFYENLNKIVILADIYYPHYLRNYIKEDKKLSYILNALNQTILSIPWNQLKNSPYGLEGCIQELFKELYFIGLFRNGVFGISVIQGDKGSFKKDFEERWQRLKLPQNSSYGFDVVPFINPKDCFKYLDFSFVQGEDLKKQTISYEVMDYVTYGIFSKNHFYLDVKYRKCLIENLIKFVYRKYVVFYLNKLEKCLKIAVDEVLRNELVEEIGKIIIKYDPFFLLFNQKSSISINGFQDGWFAPIGRNGKLFLLGSLSRERGFSFIAYLKSKIRTLLINYVGLKELKDEQLSSLDQSISSDPDGSTVIDLFVSEEDRKKYNLYSNVVAANSHAYTSDQEFYINEFANIVGVVPITLRRWDKGGWLVPIRRTGGNKGLRCYGKAQINLALKIKAQMKRKQKHQVV